MNVSRQTIEAYLNSNQIHINEPTLMSLTRFLVNKPKSEAKLYLDKIVTDYNEVGYLEIPPQSITINPLDAPSKNAIETSDNVEADKASIKKSGFFSTCLRWLRSILHTEKVSTISVMDIDDPFTKKENEIKEKHEERSRLEKECLRLFNSVPLDMETRKEQLIAYKFRGGSFNGSRQELKDTIAYLSAVDSATKKRKVLTSDFMELYKKIPSSHSVKSNPKIIYLVNSYTGFGFIGTNDDLEYGVNLLRKAIN